MSSLRAWCLRFAGLFDKERKDRELTEELESHLQLHIDDNLRSGMNPSEARRSALIKLGGLDQTKEKVRDSRGMPWLESVLQDIRFGARTLRKNPGFTTIVVLTLALGVGVTVAVFSVVNAVLLRPLNAPEANRIVQFLSTYDKGVTTLINGPQEFDLWRKQTTVFQDVSAYRLEFINLIGGSEPEQIPVARVSSDLFRLFGASILQGRTFSAEEDRPNGPHVVVLGYGFWQRRFGMDPQALGKTVVLGRDPYVVVGVLGPNFNPEQFDQSPDVWIPFQIDPTAVGDQSGYCYVAGRLKPGVTIEAGIAELQPVAEEYRRTHSADLGASQPGFGFIVQPLQEAMVGNVRFSLIILLCAVSFVLLIACANVANLLLARSTSRNREIAIRAALGAGRGRIVRQLLTESLLLFLIGGMLGLALGLVGIHGFLAQYHGYFSWSVNPIRIPRIGEAGSAVALDWHVLAFTFFTSLGTGILFGLFPAIYSSRVNLNTPLKGSSGPSVTGFHHDKLRSLLVINEITLTLVTLVGAALLIRTYVALHSVNPGFESRNVLTMQMSLTGTRFEKTADFDQLVRVGVQRISALPGVVAASSACCVPLDTVWQLPFIVTGRPLTAKYHGFAGWTFVSPSYFATFNVPILRGRAFNEHDDANSPGVAIINQAMARRFWPKGDPLNDHLIVGKGMRPEYDQEPVRQIVGIVGDVRDTALNRNPRPAMYVPIAQLPDGINTINLRQLPIAWFVRTSTEPYGLSQLIQTELREASGGLPVAHVRSMDDVKAQSTTRTQFGMLLMTIFACTALLLAAIGIYGVMSYSAQQRTHEIGIRMALGAQKLHILKMTLGEGIKVALIGLCIGTVGALVLTRFLSNLLFGVTPTDPATFASVIVLLLGVALFACYIPARRATKVDPMVALRYE